MVCSKSLLILWAMLHFTLATDNTCIVTGMWINCWTVTNDMIVSEDISKKTGLRITETNLPLIPQAFINQFARLERLFIDHNAFTELRFDHITDTLTYLDRLDANDNKITSLAEDVFRNTTNIRSLSLRGNQIQALPSKVFYGLSKLEYLSLSNNQIKTLDHTDVFWPLWNLKIIHLEHNGMTTLRLDIESLKKLELFTAEDNNLSNCSLKFSREDEANIRVDLSRNMLEVLDIAGNVKSVSARNNLIRNVNIIPLSKIKKLFLANNRINDISNITQMSSLVSLALYGNELRSFDLNDLKSLTKLESLTLDSNDMTELVGFEDLKKILPKLKTIQLSKNHFNCSYLQKLLNAVDATGVKVSVPESKLDIVRSHVRGIKCIDREDYENNKPPSNDKKEKDSNEVTENKLQSLLSAMTKIEKQLHDLSDTINSNKEEVSTLCHVYAMFINSNVDLKDDGMKSRLRDIYESLHNKH